jgi:hypothetical protein
LLDRLKIVASIKNSKNRSEVEFYNRYSIFVFESLKKPHFQRYLNWILKREKIDKEKIRNVQIRVFPFIKKNGNGLAGRCYTKKGEILLYPKRQKSCQKIKQRTDAKGFLKVLKGRARAALIHEILHIKYKKDEQKVKSLTKKYYVNFYEKLGSNPSVFEKHCKLIFNY